MARYTKVLKSLAHNAVGNRRIKAVSPETNNYYVTGASLEDGDDYTLTLTRNGGLSNITVSMLPLVSAGTKFLSSMAYSPSTYKITGTMSDSSTVTLAQSMRVFGNDIVLSGANQGAINLHENSANGNAYVSLRAPADMGTDPSYILTLPTTDGDNGQYLISNGSGVLSWATPTDANYYVTGGTYSAGAIEFSGTTGFSNFTVSSIPTGTIGGSVAEDRIAVGTATNTIGGSSNFEWDDATLKMTNTGDTGITLLGDSNRSGENSHAMAMRGKWDGNTIGSVMIMTGPDTTNKDDGQIRFATATAGNAEAEAMRIDETGNVGIGTTAPARKLHVYSGSNGYAARFEDGIELDGTNVQLLGYGQGNLWMMGNSGDPKLTLGYSHNWDFAVSFKYTKASTPYSGLSELQIGQLDKNNTNWDHGVTSFYVSGSEAMRLNKDGYLGIGTTAPGFPLSVSGTQYDMAKIASSHAAGACLYLDADGTGGSNWHLQSTADSAGSGGGKLDFVEAGTSRMIIAGGGNVGIGTTSPDRLLHLSSAGTTFMKITSDDTQDWSIGANSTAGFTVYDETDSQYRFCIKDGGNVGIGTTSPDYKLDVRKAGYEVMLVSGESNGNYPVAHFIDSTDQWPAWFEGNRSGDPGAGIRLWHNPASVNANNNTYIQFCMNDSANARNNYAMIKAGIDTTTAGAEDGHLAFQTSRAATLTEAMRIDHDGYVGIGTTSPATQLDVVGTTQLSGNSTVEGTLGVSGLITASGGVTLPATSDNFTMGGNAVNDILIDGDSYPGSSQDDYLITAKYLNTVSGAISAAAGGGTIAGTVADNYIPIANATDTVESFVLGLHDSSDYSLYIGSNPASTTDEAQKNTALGITALDATVRGDRNTAVGYNALSDLTDGNDNTAIGTRALASITDGAQNTVVGVSGAYLMNGNYNTVIGHNAAYNATSMGSCVIIGREAGAGSTNTGDDNIFIGVTAGYGNTSADKNIGIGRGALYSNLDGDNNVAIGYKAGFSNTTGTGNVFIGHLAASGATATDNDKLYIHNTNGTPLIGGDFSTKTLTFTADDVTISSTGTIKTTNNILTIQETAGSGAADNEDTASAILFKGYNYDSSTPTSVGLGRILTSHVNDMTTTANTQDGIMEFQTAVDGTLTGLMSLGYDGNSTGMNLFGVGVSGTGCGHINFPNQTNSYIYFGSDSSYPGGYRAPKIQTSNNPDPNDGGGSAQMFISTQDDIVLSAGQRGTSSNATIQFQTNDGSGGTPSDAVTRMFIDKVGNVGIGTSSPSNRLHVLSTTTPQARVAYDGTYYMTTEVSSAGSTTWTNQKSFRFTGEQTDGVFQIDQNKISLVRDTDSAASAMLQLGDHTTYDQFSIVEDARGSSATNGYLKLRAKKTGNYGYAKISLGAISGSTTSELLIDSISTNEALRFDTNLQNHALDIAKAGYVSIGAAVSTTDALYVNGTTTINGTLSATAKSFNIEHPLYKDKRLVHGSLEGPEHGIYIRGSIESKEYGCLIELPEYWEAMCEDYTVQLTPHGPYTVYIKEKHKDKVMVASTSREYKFDYYIVGSRTDETLEVVQDG